MKPLQPGCNQRAIVYFSYRVQRSNGMVHYRLQGRQRRAEAIEFGGAAQKGAEHLPPLAEAVGRTGCTTQPDDIPTGEVEAAVGRRQQKAA